MSTNWILILAFVVLAIILIRNKKTKEAKMWQDHDNMIKEGDFKGLRIMFGKQFLLAGALFLFTFILGRGFFAYKKAEKHLSYRLSDEEIENFWKEEDDVELISRLYDYIQKKSYNFLKLENLNEVEKNIMILSDLDADVNNGGFDQYFFNSRGEYNNSLIKALTAVNAPETAKICAKALDIISRGLLKDQESDLLNKECDEPYYEKSENLFSLIAEYARKNKDSLLS